MEYPKVSVLIPCFNAEKFIGQTLESVLKQSWPEIEVIVVDDGSTDGSIEEVKRFRGGKIQLIQQVSAGSGAARNRAYQASTGAFIQFLDADDLIEPDKIERQMTRLINQSSSVASAEWGRFYGSPTETKFVPECEWRDL